MEKKALANLEPRNVLRFFEELCAIPHGSGNTAAASDWAVDFAKTRGLRHRRDEAGNVVIWKDASPGYEDHPAVMLQGHLESSAGRGRCRSHRAPPAQPTVRIPSASESMFSRYLLLRSEQSRAVAPSRPVSSSTVNTASRGGWGMTPSSSTAMAMATAMPSSPPRVVPRALIQSPSTASSRLSLVKSWSTPASATHTMSRWPWGCAGGARCDLHLPLPAEDVSGDVFTLSVSGLPGGHSGAEIHKNIPNANRALAQCLIGLPGVRLISLHGGEQDNAIPGQAEARVLLPAGGADSADVEELFRKALAGCSEAPNGSCTLRGAGGGSCKALSAEDSRRALELILSAPNGVQAMEPDLPGQVRTSLDLGILAPEGGDGGPLPGGVDVHQIRAEGHRIQIRHLGGEDAALQARVDGLHLGLTPVLLLKDRHHGIPQGGVLAVLPGGVVPPAGEGRAIGQGLELLHQGLLLSGRATVRATGAAGSRADGHRINLE